MNRTQVNRVVGIQLQYFFACVCVCAFVCAFVYNIDKVAVVKYICGILFCSCVLFFPFAPTQRTWNVYAKYSWKITDAFVLFHQIRFEWFCKRTRFECMCDPLATDGIFFFRHDVFFLQIQTGINFLHFQALFSQFWLKEGVL